MGSRYGGRNHRRTPPDLLQDPEGWFHYYDRSRGRGLDKVEVCNALQDTFPGANPEAIRQQVGRLWGKFDKDRSGVLTKGEFLQKGGLREAILAEMDQPPDIRYHPGLWFRHFDRDNNGLDQREVVEGILATFPGSKPSAVQQRVAALWPTFDKDRSGRIDMREFIAKHGLRNVIIEEMSRGPAPDILHAPGLWFRHYDRDNNGLDLQEVVEALLETFPHSEPSTVRQHVGSLWARFDKDRSGRISFTEFMARDGLRDAILEEMAGGPPPDFQHQPAAWFRHFDRSSRGLDQQEVLEALLKTFPKSERSVVQAQVAQMWGNFDKDRSGRVDMKEFIAKDGLREAVLEAMGAGPPPDFQHSPRLWFRHFNRKHCGLDQHEFSEALLKTFPQPGRTPVQKCVASIWSYYRKDHSGRIDEKEFLHNEDCRFDILEALAGVRLERPRRRRPAPDLLQDPERWFAHYDRRGRQGLDRHELCAALLETFPACDPALLKEQIATLWTSFDKDLSGVISMREFLQTGGLREAILAQIDQPPDVRYHPSLWFRRFDRDNNGLDQREVVEGLLKTFPGSKRPVVQKQIDALWPTFDKDRSGRIDLKEFLAKDGLRQAIVDQIRRTPCPDINLHPGLWFRHFDHDHNGLDQHEVTEALLQMFPRSEQLLVRNRVKALWTKLDKDHSGRIDFQEFMTNDMRKAILDAMGDDEPPDIRHHPALWFRHFDRHSKGLDQKEVLEALMKTFPDATRNTFEQLIAAMWADFDKDRSGRVDMKEFAAKDGLREKILEHLGHGPPPDLQRFPRLWFRHFDHDWNGLDQNEVCKAFRATFPSADESAIQKRVEGLWPAFDTDRSGRIDESEFLKRDGLRQAILEQMFGSVAAAPGEWSPSQREQILEPLLPKVPMDQATENAEAIRAMQLVAGLMLVPRMLGFGAACLIYYYGNRELYDRQIGFFNGLAEERWGYLYLAVVAFSVLTSWLNLSPMIKKARISPGAQVNLRANMYIFKSITEDEHPGMPYVVLDEDGPEGEYNRSSRSLEHFVEWSTAVALTTPFAGGIFPFPVMIVMSVFAVGRLWHQYSYSSAGRGSHVVAFALHMLTSSILEMLVLFAALKNFLTY